MSARLSRCVWPESTSCTLGSRETTAPSVGVPVPVAGGAPARARVAAPVHRRAAGASEAGGLDPVDQVMRGWNVPAALSQEEFLQVCTERLLELLHDEIELDSERRETLSWSDDLPKV